MIPKNSVMTPMPGRKTFHDHVVEPMCHSQFGMMRIAPSTKPMYQSGCEPAVISAGLYGPNTHTGLICIVAPIKVRTPKTIRKKPPAFAAYTGKTG